MNIKKIRLADIFSVKQSGIHGQGLYAKSHIKKGSFLGTYAGKRAVNDAMHVLWIEGEKGQWEGRHGQNTLRYLNHSRQPCCEFIGFDLYALRDIAASEEVTIHYGSGFDDEA